LLPETKLEHVVYIDQFRHMLFAWLKVSSHRKINLKHLKKD